MEDKIEVGEYVRTNQGHIGVLKRIELDENDKSLKWYVFDKKEFEINIVFVDVLNQEVIYIWDKDMLEAVKQDIEEGQTLK